MSYHVHHTQGIVLGSKTYGEAHKIIFILTRERGLIATYAQSIRSHRSKLKSHIQQLSLIDADVILGKEYWKLIGAQSIITPQFLLETTVWHAWNRCAKLLLRLIPHDEPNEALFLSMYEMYMFTYNEHYQGDELVFEYLCMIRILYHLGYWSLQHKKYAEIILSVPTSELCEKYAQDILVEKEAIERRIMQTHL